MATAFDAAGDGIAMVTSAGWFRNINKGAHLAFMDWNQPALSVNTVIHVSRGTGFNSPRFQMDLTSFVLVSHRARTRRQDNDSEDFTQSSAGSTSGYKSIMATVDWTAVATAFFREGATAGTGTPGWDTGNTADTDPNQDAEIAMFNGGSNYDGDLFLIASWHRELPLEEYQCIHESEGASMIWDELQALYYLDEGGPGATMSGANSVKDISKQSRNGTPTGDPTYIETRIRRRRY